MGVIFPYHLIRSRQILILFLCYIEGIYITPLGSSFTGRNVSHKYCKLIYVYGFVSCFVPFFWCVCVCVCVCVFLFSFSQRRDCKYLKVIYHRVTKSELDDEARCKP